jgi:hypothetical protein
MNRGEIFLKKRIWLPYLIAILLIGALPQYSTVMAQDTQNPPPPDEALVKTLLQNTYATSMIFKGSNQNWDCSLTVLEKIEKANDEPENSPQVHVILYPKFTWETYITRMYKYLIHSSNGCSMAYQWLKTGEYINQNADRPIPSVLDKVTAQIIRGLKTDLIEMSNKVPVDIISPEEALRVALGVYRATYGSYPTEKFSFYLEFRDSQYWLVSFDDNDGIGGRGYLLVNAYTGDADEIKEDE